MPKQTNFAKLALYNEATDAQLRYGQFRSDIAGDKPDSNMNKIDKKLEDDNKKINDITQNQNETKSVLKAHTENQDIHVSSTDRVSINKINNHINNEGIHVTLNEKSKWDNKAEKSVVESHIKNGNIHTSYSEKEEWNNNVTATNNHIIDTNVHITPEERISWNNKANLSALSNHTSNSDIHVTKGQKNSWNTHISNEYIHVTNQEKIEWNNSSAIISEHVENSTIHISPQDRNNWNNKASKTEFDSHKNNLDIHVSLEDKNDWNTTSTNSNFHINNKNIHVTSEEKRKWNDVNGLLTATHTTTLSNNVIFHNLNISSGSIGNNTLFNVVFKATESYKKGNPFRIDVDASNTYYPRLSNGEIPEDDIFVNGAVVNATIDTVSKTINFKSAGSSGDELPAESTCIVAKYVKTPQTPFVVPVTGLYRITVVGHGGAGGGSSVEPSQYGGLDSRGGAGGASGGVAQIKKSLKKGDSFAITVDKAISSFGNILSATGASDSFNTSPGEYGIGTGGYYCFNGLKAESSYNSYRATDGVAYTVAIASISPLLLHLRGGEKGIAYGDTVTQRKGKRIPFAYGSGAGGTNVKLSQERGESGAEGAAGVVLVELLCEDICKLSSKYNYFADNSWDTIIKACETNSIPESWNIGDNKIMKINGIDYQIDIIGKNHDEYSTGGMAPITFGIHSTLEDSYAMSSQLTNIGGWTATDMYKTYLPEILNQMPENVKSHIKIVSKTTGKGGALNSSVDFSDNKLFLFSEEEIFGEVLHSANGEKEHQYEYYKINGSHIKTRGDKGEVSWWWLRSPEKKSDNMFCRVSGTGEIDFSGSLNEAKKGPVFGFCF